MEKMRQWSILTAVGVVAVLAAGWFLLVSPQHSHAADIRTQVTSQEQATASVQSQVNQLEQQKNGLPAQQRKLAKMATQVPDSPALPTLIRQLSAAAHDANVQLVALSPSAPATVASSAVAAPTTAAGTPAAPAPLAQIPLNLQISGSYFNIESFFHAVEHLDRAMLVTSFSLAPADTAGAGSTTGGSAPAAASPGALPTGWLNGQVTAVVFESPEAAAAQATVPQTPTTQTTTPATSGSTAPSPQGSTAASATPAN